MEASAAAIRTVVSCTDSDGFTIHVADLIGTAKQNYSRVSVDSDRTLRLRSFAESVARHYPETTKLGRMAREALK